ncbi:(2Fe-2S)-binding protein [Arthrobacter gengyunqii]|uniref:(2Fe-2S)-binding protein n=1 Tax=Arthrobacter gengyunqii TaxID=2886940 RepID=A0A9X1M4Y9_9MICC|nr:(2Fe-2S)-binding protein [Arthrobacter gengyunqii]MCC3270364.1 (2Fe-2S)-binding protein [Arthrobacter gengyunqii]UOY97558.1 (2Fe-2S)-binding protein [Arthrobacter gengyunqii]
MSEVSLPLRLARAVGTSPVADRVAAAQEFLYKPLLEWAWKSPFHTGVLGHWIHPPLTDLTLGCWGSASILDVAGGAQSRHGATVLIGAGLAAAVPTAIAGASDWAGMAGDARRIGVVHALGTDVAVFANLGSLIALTCGQHGLGVALALAGNAVLAGSGFLGGHLVLNRGTARRVPADV